MVGTISTQRRTMNSAFRKEHYLKYVANLRLLSIEGFSSTMIDPQYGRRHELVQGRIERKGRLCS